MKKFFSIIALSIIAFSAIAQRNITVSSSMLSFSTKNELQTDSLPLTLTNPSGIPLAVELKFFTIYGSNAFSCADSVVTVSPGASQTIFIRFNPKHNIFNNSELVLRVKTPNGAFYYNSHSVDLRGQGTYSNTYYSSTQNLEGEALKLALRARLTQGYNTLGYSGARDQMFMFVDNQRTNGQGASVNTLECVYTARTITGYTSRTQAQNAPNDFNTEHTFPQSLFSSTDPMYSDLHHLFPTDNTANNTRSNYPFGIVANPSWQVGGSKFGGNVFEPRDYHKGRVARAMMYFGVRHGANSLVQISYLTPQEAIFRQWNEQFPVTTVDMTRNNNIQTVQGNRNCFVDYPQFMNRLASVSNNADFAPYRQLYVSNNSIFVYDTAEVVFVNTSNMNITLSNHSVTGGYTLVGALPDTVRPNESATIRVKLTTGGTGTLYVVTNVSLNDSIRINLIGSNATKSLTSDEVRIATLENGWELFSPIQGFAGKGYLYDATGKIVKTVALSPNSAAMIGNGELAGGIYILRIETQAGTFTSRLKK